MVKPMTLLGSKPGRSFGDQAVGNAVTWDTGGLVDGQSSRSQRRWHQNRTKEAGYTLGHQAILWALEHSTCVLAHGRILTPKGALHLGIFEDTKGLV